MATLKSAGLLVLVQVLAMTLATSARSQSIKDTKKFLGYFNQIRNMTEYKTLKQKIEAAGATVIHSSTVADSDKAVLKADYGLVAAKSDSLVDKISADLVSQSERKKMVKDPGAYVISLNGIFSDIKTADSLFNIRYESILGANRGSNFTYSVTDFDLPLDPAFGDEIITALIKKLISSQLKKVVSLKPWDDL